MRTWARIELGLEPESELQGSVSVHDHEIMRESIQQAREDWERIDIELEPLAEMQRPIDDQRQKTMRESIERVSEDLKDLQQFYNIEMSETRKSRLKTYYEDELADLKKTSFKSLDQQGKIDYLLLQNFLEKGLKQLELDGEKDQKMEPLLPFARTLVRLCEDRQMMRPVDGEKAANDVFPVGKQIPDITVKVKEGKLDVDKTTAFRAASSIDKLRSHLAEWFSSSRGMIQCSHGGLMNRTRKLTKSWKILRT